MAPGASALSFTAELTACTVTRCLSFLWNASRCQLTDSAESSCDEPGVHSSEPVDQARLSA